MEGGKIRKLGFSEKWFTSQAEFGPSHFVESVHITSQVEITDEQVTTSLRHVVR